MQVAAHGVSVLGQVRYFQRTRLADKGDLQKVLVLLDQQLENSILGYSKCQQVSTFRKRNSTCLSLQRQRNAL